MTHNLPGGQVALWTVNKQTCKNSSFVKLGYSRATFEYYREQYVLTYVLLNVVIVTIVQVILKMEN